MISHAPAIQVTDIHKSFGSLEVLKGVSFVAEKGEVVAMIGSSGSGKSTLLRCINMLEVPDHGQVAIAGEMIRMKKTGRGLKPASFRQVERIRTRLGMVFQDFNLWEHMTVLQNIMEAPVHVLKTSKSDAGRTAGDLLEKVGLKGKEGYYPAQLSGGEKQRVAIARALAVGPKALLFDEPTSALDPELVGEVLRVIKALADEGRTMIIVTHEIGFAADVADKVLFLHNGRIEEEGDPVRVIENPTSERCRAFLSQSYAKR